METSTALVLANKPNFLTRNPSTEEQQKLIQNMADARSLNTRISYEGAWSRFVEWCAKQGFQSFPAEPWAVALYVNHLNDEGYKISTLESAVCSIQAVHKDSGTNTSYFQNHLVKSALVASQRQMADDGRSAVKKPSVIPQDSIKKLMDSMGNTAIDYRNRALLSLGFNSGLRASEIASLRTTDIEFDAHGMMVKVRKSKGDQLGQGQQFYIQSLASMNQSFDAVHHMKKWLTLRESYGELLNNESPVFFAIRRGGNTPMTRNRKVSPMTRQGISSLISKLAKDAGLEGEYSAHSLRHSFVTLAFERGVDASKIAKITRHKNLGVLAQYDQSSIKQSAFNNSLWG